MIDNAGISVNAMLGITVSDGMANWMQVESFYRIREECMDLKAH